MNKDIQNTLKDGYEALLLGYAAGNLNEAQNLIVSTHLTLSNEGQAFVSACEDIGGMLIDCECEPADMNEDALDRVLEKLDDYCETQNAQKSCDLAKHNIEFDVPESLKSCLASGKVQKKWTTLFPGMKALDLNLKCNKSVARIMQAAPGVKSPHHTHGGTEITLVLDGAFSDETGTYKRGDLIVTNEACDHTPLACPEQGCTCLVVTNAPVKFMGLASILNPFLKT